MSTENSTPAESSPASRHRAREVALQILYRYEVQAHTTQTQPPQGSELAQDLIRHFEHFSVPQGLREFAAQLVAGTLAEAAEIDPLIEKRAQSWKINRMPPVDRSLLRMATYELKHFADTPVSVILNEAIELAKQFGTAETPTFINGVLDALQKDVR